MVRETELLKRHNISLENSFFLQYLAEIRNGNIIVGREIRKELENLEHDLLYDDRWIYNTKLAHVYLDFIETFLKHTKSPFYGEPLQVMMFPKSFIR